MTARKGTKKYAAPAETLFCQLNLLLFRRSCCDHDNWILRSLLLIKSNLVFHSPTDINSATSAEKHLRLQEMHSDHKHTLTLCTINFLNPSGMRCLVFLLLPYPILGIIYIPLNFLLTLLSIPLGLRQLGYRQ